MARSRRRTFFEWVTNRYEMIIRNEADFEERRTFVFTYGKVFLSLFVLFCLTTGASLLFAKYLKSEWFSPEYEYSKIELKLVKYSERLDSMERELDQKHKYIISFKHLLDPEFDESTIYTDELNTSSLEEIEEEEYDYLTEDVDDAEVDSKSIEQVSQISKMGLFARRIFVSPVSHAIVIDTFNFEEKKYSTSLKTKVNESIRVIDDGKVVLCNWDKDEGFVIAIEHANKLISLYKGNELLLKQVGNYVQGGEIIALAKGSVAHTDTRIELWHDGNPLDAREFIRF